MLSYKLYLRFIVIFGLLGVSALDAAGQPVLDRVGPPSWWVTATDQQVMLLLEGAGLDAAKVRFASGPARIDRVEVVPGGRTLIAEATIPANATPAVCRLEITVAGRTINRNWDLVAPPSRPAASITPDDVLYLVMPDRFADGNPGNNEPGTEGDPMLDRANPHAYHGGDFDGLRARLPYLADLGVTAVWLTPIYKPAPRWYGGSGKNSRRYADFHGYSPVDFYDTNPHFGTRAEYQSLVDEAHRLGLKVVQDHILGFTGPQHPWAKQPPTPDWFNGPLDHPPVCDFKFDAATNPHAPDSARRLLTDGWFLGILPDLDLRNSQPARYALQQSLWWATLGAADGVRLDTYPMVVRSFWPEWSRRLDQARPGIRAVGEAWINDPADVAFFQGGRSGWDGVDPGVASVFDFPLHAAINQVFAGKGPASDLARILSRDHVYPRPDLLTTFLDNHDTARLAAVPGVTPARLRLAAAFVLTTRGTPQLTWGDEIGMGGHSDDRRDFPGGFAGDSHNAFTRQGRTPDEQSTFTTYRDLLQIRRDQAPLRRGKLTILIADATTYVALRDLDGQKVLVAIHLGSTAGTVTLPPTLAGSWQHLYGPGRWTSTPQGLTFNLPPESATICRNK